MVATDLAPVHFLSHGTTMLLGEDSKIRDYWRKLGRDALKHGVKGIIIMVRSEMVFNYPPQIALTVLFRVPIGTRRARK